jgi:hypothetical protein
MGKEWGKYALEEERSNDTNNTNFNPNKSFNIS